MIYIPIIILGPIFLWRGNISFHLSWFNYIGEKRHFVIDIGTGTWTQILHSRRWYIHLECQMHLLKELLRKHGYLEALEHCKYAFSSYR